MPELKDNALRHRVGFLGCLCRVRVWTQFLRDPSDPGYSTVLFFLSVNLVLEFLLIFHLPGNVLEIIQLPPKTKLKKYCLKFWQSILRRNDRRKLNKGKQFLRLVSDEQR